MLLIKTIPSRKSADDSEDDQCRSLWNKYDWWRPLEEMKNALGRKVLVGEEKLFGQAGNSSSARF